MEACFPFEKAEKVRKHLLNMQCKNKKQLRELQSLIGLLIFACLVFLAGRAFLQRLIDFTCGVENQQDLINLTDEIHADIDTWLSLLSSFN